MTLKKAKEIIDSYNYVFKSGEQAYMGYIVDENKKKLVIKKVNILQRTPSSISISMDRYLIGDNGKVFKCAFRSLFPTEKDAKRYLNAVITLRLNWDKAKKEKI